MLEHIDVVVVGGGLAGVGAAYHLQTSCPDRSVAILEARDGLGGTWDLFRYPGIRSDSDMHTLGYAFRPWASSQALADGAAIREYIRDTAREHGIEELVRFDTRVIAAAWSTEAQRWLLELEHPRAETTSTLSCSHVHICAGYYRYDAGYLPSWPGMAQFTGRVVHPQHWPEDLDCRGLRTVVIGSGATAVTLVPTLAQRGAHVTMLQRSPSYVVAVPRHDPIVRLLDGRLPSSLAHGVVRWKNIALITLAYRAARYAPRLTRAGIRRLAQRLLPDRVDVDEHFRPRYEPWEQRVCFVPDGDFFDVLNNGTARVVTDSVDRFTASGIELAGGEHLDADVVVAATGLDVQLLGGIELTVDGTPVKPSDTVAYKAMMLSGVPNLSFAIGYTNASWTLKCDLVAEHLGRLLGHMDAHGYTQCTPDTPDKTESRVPFVDLTSGYIKRGAHLFPTQARRLPWRTHGNYFRDRRLYQRGPIDDGLQLRTVTVTDADHAVMA